jgi:hypothetical protein
LQVHDSSLPAGQLFSGAAPAKHFYQRDAFVTLRFRDS